MAKFDPEKITGRQTDKQAEAGEVARAIDTGKGGSRAHTAVSKEEKTRREAEGRTQGAKGCKSPRMNITLTTDNYKIVTTASRSSGVSYSRFINALIDKYRIENPELCEKALEVYDLFNGLEDVTE